MKQFFLFCAAFICSVPVFAQASAMGPDAPQLNANVSGSSISIVLSNLVTSNNYNETYNVWDYSQHGTPDSTWDFEGYLVFQVSNCLPQDAYYAHLSDTNYARLVAQCDRTNGVDTLIDHLFANSCAPQTVVYGADAGIQHNFIFTVDAFTGAPFVLGNTYSYTAVAYAHNAFHVDSGCVQTSPCLFGVHQNVACVMLSGIRERTTLSSLPIFPNPAQATLSLDLSAFQSPVAIVIRDLTGRELLVFPAESGNSAQLPIENLAPGAYFVEAMDGEVRMGSRFVKE